MSNITYYDYQRENIDRNVEFLMRKKPKNGVSIIPTAGGKSYTIAGTALEISEKGIPVVVLQPSQELLSQNYSKFNSAGGRAAVFSASFNSKQVGAVTYATLGSVYKHGGLFKGAKLIIDEAHLYPNADLDGRLSMLGRFMEESGIKHVLGTTATPIRLVKSELKFITRMRPRFYQDVVHVVQVQDIIDRGLWSKMLYQDFSKDFDYSALKLNSSGSDYTESSMESMWFRNKMSDRIVRQVEVAKAHGRRSILVFVPSVAKGEQLALRIPGACMVSGKTPDADRDRIITGFKNGSISVVINVNVLSTGFDHPGLDCILCARPTRSFQWYYQMLGRGTRIDRTGVKKDCWFYDFTDNYKRFGKVETIQIRDVPGFGWGIFTGQGGRLISNLPLDSDYPFTMHNCMNIKQYLRQQYSTRYAG